MKVIEVTWYGVQDLILVVQCVVCNISVQEAWEIGTTGTYICNKCIDTVHELEWQD